MTDSTSDFDFDLFVIGGGSGGVRAGRIAAGHGARVAVAEGFRFGGTCVIRGCVPKKLLVYASRFADEFADARGFGWQLDRPRFDWPALIAAKDKEIARLEAIYRENLEKSSATTFAQHARIEGPNTVRLADGQRYRARHILIATGGQPAMPENLPGIELALSSNEIFDLPTLPRRIAIVGAGYIGLEFATILAGLGVETTVVYRRPKPLHGFDDDLVTELVTALQGRGIALRPSTSVQRLVREADGRIRVELSAGEPLVVDQVLMATGRAAATTGLGLETVGVATDRNGAIKVDADGRTSATGIFAIGDVTDQLNLTPVAIRQGHAFADSTFGNKPWQADLRHVPTAVFTTPEIGTVGLTEAQARAELAVTDIYRTRFRTLKATLSGSQERMLMKLVVDGRTDRLVGVHLLGPDAGELIQVIATLLRTGATKADLDATMPLHPSSAEELMTLRTRSARHAREG